MKRLSIFSLIASAAASLVGCTSSGASSAPPADPVPAVLTDGSSAALSNLKARLASAVGRAQIELGPEDPTMMSFISVLPPRLGTHETHSLASPTTFDLQISDGKCYAQNRETRNRILLDGIDCKPVG